MAKPCREHASLHPTPSAVTSPYQTDWTEGEISAGGESEANAALISPPPPPTKDRKRYSWVDPYTPTWSLHGRTNKARVTYQRFLLPLTLLEETQDWWLLLSATAFRKQLSLPLRYLDPDRPHRFVGVGSLSGQLEAYW